MPETEITQPTTTKGRTTRRALLAAAEEVFGEHSYDRASVAEITRRAGVAQGTFYVYFPDKKAAFVELVRYLNHDLRRSIAASVAGLTDRVDIERAGFRAFFDYTAEHRSLYKVMREAEFVDEDLYLWHYRTLSEGYQRGLRTAMAAGQITDEVDPETLSYILMGISEFMGSRWVILERRPPPDVVIDQVMGFIARGLGHDEMDGDKT